MAWVPLARTEGDTLAYYLGEVGQNQEQGGGEENKPGLAYFRIFEHGDLPFFVIPGRRCGKTRAQLIESALSVDKVNLRGHITYGLEPFYIIHIN